MGLTFAAGIFAKVGKFEVLYSGCKYVGENRTEFLPAPSMLPPLLCVLFSFSVLPCLALAFMLLKMKLELKGKGAAVAAKDDTEKGGN